MANLSVVTLYLKNNIKYAIYICIDIHINMYFHSHKKRKDGLEASLDRVLHAAELELPKILVSRLPQHTSMFFDQLFGALVDFNFIILTLTCF